MSDSIENAANDPNQQNIVIPTNYEQIGHIAHFNLRENVLRYKFVIGQVYLEKLPNVRTVVNKTGSIENQYRVLPMEVIGGTPDFKVTVRENGCRFSFDFSKVYWNSKLGTEHQRMCTLFQRHQVICDMMSGVGPFAVPAAKQKECVVHANDLNPDSHRALLDNLRRNEVESLVTAYNLCGRAFWRKLCANKKWIAQQNEEKLGSMGWKSGGERRRFVDHVLLNLPKMAMEFLNEFRGCFEEKEVAEYGLPTVHCYCFANDVGFEREIKEQLIQYLGAVPTESDGLTMRKVRNVSPHLNMYCVSFSLPKEIALGKGEDEQNGKVTERKCDEPPPLKKQKTDLACSAK